MRGPGRLLASGREADVFEYGPGLVLRCQREGRSMADEVRIMEHVRALGYPVPAVDELSDDGLRMVLERVDGPSMVDAIARRPWSVGRQGAVLADLHRRLHELPAPAWLPPAPVGTGDRIVHLDLHPLNVLIGPSGPVVIDWPRAARGDPATDVALTWALMAAGEVHGGPVLRALQGVGRRVLVRRFLGGGDADAARARLAEVVAWKSGDVHMSASERDTMRRLVTTEGGRS